MIFEMGKTDKHAVYNLLIGLVAPRPIAWVTTRNEDGGINAAPYSAYNYLSIDRRSSGSGSRTGQREIRIRRTRRATSGEQGSLWSTL